MIQDESFLVAERSLVMADDDGHDDVDDDYDDDDGDGG